MEKPKIGFIGLGLMGANMVENLQNRGFELTV
ncbi:MAG: NAD(P)-binding domain-containing protein, partial [Wenyingzhuangia sp.]